jgi:galactoside 2-L-fucosyltransferase 1/2
VKDYVAVRESGFAMFDPTLFRQNRSGFHIIGNLQSYKYLSLVGTSFSFEKRVLHKVAQYLKRFNTSNTVGFHVRRTDMLLQPPERVQVPSYFYEMALRAFRKRFGNNMAVIVVSDDLEWCKRQDVFMQPYVYMPEDFRHPVEALALMAQCTHHVVTMGTFGWWGAWLGTKRDSIIVYHNEFNITHPARRNVAKLDDYYPPTWIEL